LQRGYWKADCLYFAIVFSVGLVAPYKRKRLRPFESWSVCRTALPQVLLKKPLAVGSFIEEMAPMGYSRNSNMGADRMPSVVPIIGKSRDSRRTTTVTCQFFCFAAILFAQTAKPELSDHAVFQKYFVIHCPALVARLARIVGGNHCRIYSGFRVRRIQGKTSRTEETKGTSGSRGANFNLRENCPPTIPNWRCGRQRA
jgi:hypothetical protein